LDVDEDDLEEIDNLLLVKIYNESFKGTINLMFE